MANHGYAKTLRFIRPLEVLTLLNRLNRERWKGLVDIEYAHNTDQPDFEHVWILRYNGDDEKYWRKGATIRQFWLASRRCLEMKHGGGGHWCWWIDFTILHEVAFRYDGIVMDDSDGERVDPHPQKYHEFEPFVRMMIDHVPDHIKPIILKHEMDIIPTPFHFEVAQ